VAIAQIEMNKRKAVPAILDARNVTTPAQMVTIPSRPVTALLEAAPQSGSCHNEKIPSTSATAESEPKPGE
jgi:hypothetical protein